MKNKRGIFFTMLAVIILSIFLISATVISSIAVRKTIQKRVQSLSGFVFATEENLQRQLYIFGFRTLYLIQEDVLETNSPATNVSAIFEEAFFNGTVNGEEEALLIDVKYNDTINSIQEKAQKISADITFYRPSIKVTQDDPWHVKVIFTANFLVNDKNNLASWNKTLVSVSYIPIEGFSDPEYTIGTAGKFPVNITKTPYSVFVSGSDTSNLSSHLFNSFYAASTDAPSFLDRLEGKFSPDANGIESLIDLAELDLRTDNADWTKSIVDHVYFSGVAHQACAVTPSGNLPSWFKLDDEHYTRYGVSPAC